MGVDLGNLFKKEKISFNDLRDRVIVIDAHNVLHQFLSIIRQRDGTPLRDSKGQITSHLSGLFYRTANIIEARIRPVYVFDGEPHPLKAKTIEQRRERREKAERDWKVALEKGDIEKARELTERVHEYATKTKSRTNIIHAEMLKAMLFKEQKKWKQSIRYFEKTLEECKVLNAQKWYVINFAELLCEYGLMYLDRNEDNDKEKASSLLSQALGIYQQMYARKRVEKVKSIMIYTETGQRIASKPVPATVEAPKTALPSFIATGSDDLDNLLLGGIPRNYTVILTSPSCDERDLLIKRFLETGAEKGQTTFYVTAKASGIENLAEEFPSGFYLFICNPQADKIIKSLPNVFKLKGVENLNDINIALASAFRKLDKIPSEPRRACIEIISDVLLQHHAVHTRRWLNALIPELRSNGFTTLAVIDPQMHPPQEFHAIMNLFGGEINIYEKDTAEGLQRFLKIKKMTNQKYSKSELSLQEEKPQE